MADSQAPHLSGLPLCYHVAQSPPSRDDVRQCLMLPAPPPSLN